jgi:hypothetical protein
MPITTESSEKSKPEIGEEMMPSYSRKRPR